MKILEILTVQRTIGTIGERAAARHLKRLGYRILKRNFVAADAEIDLVVTKGDVVAFVEVKTRTADRIGTVESRPAAAVTPEKQRKILRASRFFPIPSGKLRRFDVVEVILTERRRVRSISHLVGTFDRDSAARGYRR